MSSERFRLRSIVSTGHFRRAHGQGPPPEVALASFSALAMSVYLAVVLLVKLKRN